MASLNQVTLLGNLTRDVEMKFLPSNTAVANTGLALNRKWKDAQGQTKEEVCFVDIAAFGKQAEVVNQYCHKGDLLLVVGRLKLDQWDDKNGGGKRSRLSVVVESLQLMPKKDGQGAPGKPQQRQAPADQRGAQDQSGDDNGDIPF